MRSRRGDQIMLIETMLILFSRFRTCTSFLVILPFSPTLLLKSHVPRSSLFRLSSRDTDLASFSTHVLPIGYQFSNMILYLALQEMIPS